MPATGTHCSSFVPKNWTATVSGRRIREAAGRHTLVLADTTALMTAVYSELLFDDRSLYAEAMAEHARCELTLLTSLDLAWVADGLQRDGPHVREPVDRLVRQALIDAGQPFGIVAGQGDQRLRHALAMVDQGEAAIQIIVAADGNHAIRRRMNRRAHGGCHVHAIMRRDICNAAHDRDAHHILSAREQGGALGRSAVTVDGGRHHVVNRQVRLRRRGGGGKWLAV